jgi:hypothetical protein
MASVLSMEVPMRIAKATLLATIAAVALATSAGMAAVRTTDPTPPMHTLTVKAPDGSIARISYSGNVAPIVHFVPAVQTAAAIAPAWPFANVARISAAMNREMDVLMQQADMLTSPVLAVGPLYNAALLHPMGPSGWPMIARASAAPGMCMQSVEVSRIGNAAPHVVEHMTGNCGKSEGMSSTTAFLPRNGEGHLVPLGPAAAHRSPQVREVHYLPQ